MPLSYPHQLVITKTPGLLAFPHNITFLLQLHRQSPAHSLVEIRQETVRLYGIKKGAHAFKNVLNIIDNVMRERHSGFGYLELCLYDKGDLMHGVSNINQSQHSLLTDLD